MYALATKRVPSEPVEQKSTDRGTLEIDRRCVELTDGRADHLEGIGRASLKRIGCPTPASGLSDTAMPRCRGVGAGDARDSDRRARSPARSLRPSGRPLTARLVRHGLSCPAAAGGRLLQPDDAQAESLEAGGIRRAIASRRRRPRRPARSDRPAVAVRVIGMRGKEWRGSADPRQLRRDRS